MNVDREFNLLLSGRTGERDTRPMMYPGRVLTLEGRPIADCWKRSSLITGGRTEPCDMLKAAEMDVVDHVGDDNLPKTTSFQFPKEAKSLHRLVNEDGMLS